jgi:hypothetical protein
MVFQTIEGEIAIGHVTSAIDTSAERELILKTRAFLDSPTTKEFGHRASMHGFSATWDWSKLGAYGSSLVRVVGITYEERFHEAPISQALV